MLRMYINYTNIMLKSKQKKELYLCWKVILFVRKQGSKFNISLIFDSFLIITIIMVAYISACLISQTV